MPHLVKNDVGEDAFRFQHIQIGQIELHSSHGCQALRTSDIARTGSAEHAAFSIYIDQGDKDEDVVYCLVHCWRGRPAGPGWGIKLAVAKVLSDRRLPTKSRVIERLPFGWRRLAEE